MYDKFSRKKLMAARPLWKGQITFGLVNVPVSLYPAVGKTEIHFHLLDSRNMARVRYERVNEETGEEVPWNEIVKAYEYNGGDYVIVEEKELKKAAPESTQSIEIESFIPRRELDCVYFDKPYYLVPVKNGEKGYVILREVLKKTKTVGIARIVIRSKQYLAAVFPYQKGIMVNLLRFAQEFRKTDELNLPTQDIKKYKITPKELSIAEQLVNSMLTQWKPEKYHDEFREKIMKWVEAKIKTGKTISIEKEEAAPVSTNVVDFMQLLKKSIQEKEKTKKHASGSR
ncbi:Ku protein [Coxiella burnetii]|uniref:Non-homologous end joining protein Ku n=2 Tax=Coxiella burnetii TaxID=777 RepID=A9KBG9_COXBN|nr:hypothetical DNA-binding protein [Coxiella burnetii Dugway 5J108-111]OYK83130.1 Ku protein [Coxiella burnetii]